MPTTLTSSTDLSTTQMTDDDTTIPTTDNSFTTLKKSSTPAVSDTTTTVENTTPTSTTLRSSSITVTTPIKAADYSLNSTSTRFSSSETTSNLTTRGPESVSTTTQSGITEQHIITFVSIFVVSLLLLIIACLCIKNCQKDRKLRSFEAAIESQEDPWVSEAGDRYATTGSAAAQTPVKQEDKSGSLYSSMPALAIASQEELRYILSAAKKSSELSTFTPGPENFRKRPPATGMRKFIKTNANAPLGIHTFAEQIKLKNLPPEIDYEGWADNVAYEAFKSAEENTVSGVQTSHIDGPFYEVIEM